MRVLIGISLLVAFSLTVFPLPHEWRGYRPEFVVLLVIYWSVFAPRYFGLMVAWLVGLSLDLLFLSPLGFHALGTLLVAYLAPLVYQRISHYALWHQAVWVFVLVGIYQLLCNWLGGFWGQTIDTPLFLVAALLSGLLWPLLIKLMNHVLAYFHLTQ